VPRPTNRLGGAVLPNERDLPRAAGNRFIERHYLAVFYV
jgi:hypothetical protein